MLKINRKLSRGDTLIEVLFATAIFSLVAVGGLSIMNQGTSASQRALEITLVRNEMDAQAETLRFLNASYIAAFKSGLAAYPAGSPAQQWKLMHDSIKATNNTNTSPFGVTGAGVCPTAFQTDGSFILNTHLATFVDPSAKLLKSAKTFSQVRYNNLDQVAVSEGIWIEAVRKAPSGNNQDNAAYIDFNIRACWDGPGQTIPLTLGTIVRLYEPN